MNNLKESTRVLEEINALIVDMSDAIMLKKSEWIKKEKKDIVKIETLEKNLEELKASSSEIVGNMDKVIEKLSKVLENVPSNHNN